LKTGGRLASVRTEERDLGMDSAILKGWIWTTINGSGPSLSPQ
jgi:hypothetical protein